MAKIRPIQFWPGLYSRP